MNERCFDQCLAQEEAEIRKEFQRFDLDKNGYITKGRYYNLSWRNGVREAFIKKNILLLTFDLFALDDAGRSALQTAK